MKLLINMKKFSFMQEEIVYLGFVISVDRLKMDPKKVNWSGLHLTMWVT